MADTAAAGPGGPEGSERPLSGPCETSAASFRYVLSRYATGVAAITAKPDEGPPAAMLVGSFTSVSLDPPLVGFFPDRKSTSWPRIQQTGHFCVNILAEHQEAVGNALASKAPDKLAGIPWRSAASGAPRLTDAVAWIDCDIERVDDAGDHYFVLGHVRELNVQSATLPLLFFRGGYGHFRPGIMVSSEPDVTAKLPYVDAVRPAMASLAAQLDTTCTAVVRSGRQTVLAAAAAAGAGESVGSVLPTPVGSRFPFAPPLGTVFAAWGRPDDVETWTGSHLGGDQAYREVCAEMIDRVRRRGYSIGLGHSTHAQLEEQAHLPSPDQPMTATEMARRIDAMTAAMTDYNPAELSPDRRYEVRHLSAPVLDQDGAAVLELTVWGPGDPIGRAEIDHRATALLAACAAAGATLRNARAPAPRT